MFWEKLAKKIKESFERRPLTVVIKIPSIISFANGKSFKGYYCAICRKEIEEEDELVVIPTSGFYANVKNFWVSHKGCFLKLLEEIFHEEIKLTEKGVKEVLESEI